MTTKEIIVLGDIEMGAGTYTDDFISDNALSQLILELADRQHPVDLVLNGDTFDFLKCPYIINNQNTYPRHITEQISLTKLDSIFKAHKTVFMALRTFLKKKDKHLYFVLGNHDHDLSYKAVQEELRNLLQNSTQVHFPGLAYKYGQVYVEHGQQYDFLNRVNPNHQHLTYRGKTILNIPWVSLGLISKFMFMKEQHPFMERIFPRQAMFRKHRNVYKKVSHRSLIYLLKSFLYYPLRYRHDPTYIYPKEILKDFYRRIKNIHWDVDKIMDKFKRRKKRSKHSIHVLSHIHEIYLEDSKGKVFIHPGSWRDEYDLDANGKLIPRVKLYVQILESEEGFTYKLVDVEIDRKFLDFDTVKMDEHSHIKLVAEEEGYNYVFE